MTPQDTTIQKQSERIAELEGELREINGCLDWGRIANGATTLSEVQRTIGVLRETQHAFGQQRIAFEMEIDSLRAALASQQADAGRLDAVERLRLPLIPCYGLTRRPIAFGDPAPPFEGYVTDTQDHEPKTLRAAIDAALPAPPAAASEQGDDGVCPECGGSGMLAHFDGEGNELGMDGCGNCQGTGRISEQPSPSANPVDPGEGWRLLEHEKDRLQDRDELHMGPWGGWVLVHPGFIGCELAMGITYRRRITAQAEQGGAV